MRLSFSLVAAALTGGAFAVACSSSSTGPQAAAPAGLPPDAQMSDPAEYHVDHVSEEAGATIFARTGVGDPYRTGLPLPIFLAMMAQYPDLLGKNTTEMAGKFGFIARPRDPTSGDRDVQAGLPIGFHLTDDPNTHVPFVVHNCAICHTEVVRWPGGEKQVLGIGSRRIRIHAFDQAIATITRDANFDREHIGPLATRLAQENGVSWPTAWRGTVLSGTFHGLKDRLPSREPLLARIKDGLPGRVATIESFAVALSPVLHNDITMAKDVGWAKIPDTIGYANKRGLSWDGGSEGPSDAMVVDADLAAGMRIEWLVKHPWQGPSVSAFLRHLPRDLPFPGPIDASLARRGKVEFERACSKCHGTYQDDGRAKSYVEQIIPVEYLETDPARALAPTDSFVAAANDPKLQPFGPIVHTRRTMGYVPPVLTSIWARAPYGHAGQWPSLKVMAMPPAERPTHFVVHGDAPLDLKTVGVPITEGATTLPAAPGDYAQDGTQEGFHVTGHPFLADLGPTTPAVLEYLKTL